MVDAGGKLGHLWMEGFFGVGDPLAGSAAAGELPHKPILSAKPSRKGRRPGAAKAASRPATKGAKGRATKSVGRRRK